MFREGGWKGAGVVFLAALALTPFIVSPWREIDDRLIKEIWLNQISAVGLAALTGNI